jgi:N-acetylglucosaminyldiphosphoundecaprenol N-acetyl-beta-D-mannosaminyltransferase
MLSKCVLGDHTIEHLKLGDSVVVFNTESSYFYFKDPTYRAYVNACSHISVDGVGLQLTLRMIGFNFPRFHGSDLLNRIISERDSWRIILAGGSKKNIELVDAGIINSFIDLPFSNSIDSIFEHLLINLSMNVDQSKPIVLLISLGLPKQELIAHKLLQHYLNRADANVPLIIVPIGAAVDFLTGQKQRAGVLWRKFGLEWLPRMIREPRMIPRVIRSFKGILLLVYYELFGNKR